MTDSVLEELYEAAVRWPASPDPNIYRRASDKIRGLEAKLESLAKLHYRDGETVFFGSKIVPTCHCDAPWPCPTARVLGVAE